MSRKMTALALLSIVASFALGAYLFWPRREPSMAANPPVAITPPTSSHAAALPTDSAVTATTRASVEVDDGLPVLVSTEAIKSGELKWADINTPSLLYLLVDLHERLGNDRAQHGGNPGPDAPYLSEWIENTNDHLRQRGFQVNADGKVTPPGPK